MNPTPNKRALVLLNMIQEFSRQIEKLSAAA
jgi:hypothetical protein